MGKQMGKEKIIGENQRFDWTKSIHGYGLVIVLLVDISLFNSMIWLI